MKTFIIIAAALSLSGLSATAASAENVRVSTTVASQDLNLTSPNGVKTLKLRIHHAACQLCGGSSFSHYREERKAFKACYQSATESTIAAVQAKTNVIVAAR